MGSKGSYSGGGGAAGDAMRDGLDDWLANLPGEATAAAAPTDNNPGGVTNSPTSPSLTPDSRRVLPTAALFRSSRSSGGSHSRQRDSGSAQLTRSTAMSARAAGRGAAAAYAYRTGDAATLRDLGLDYDALRANPNIFDVANQIAQKVCEDLPPGTIETDELLHVVGDLAEWLVETDAAGAAPSLALIAQESVALILATAYLTETAAKLNDKNMPPAERAALEDSIREACEELAAQTDLSPSGPTAAEFTAAIEDGLEYLHSIYEGGSDD